MKLNIKRLRAQRGMRVKDLARLMGFSCSKIDRHIRGVEIKPADVLLYKERLGL